MEGRPGSLDAGTQGAGGRGSGIAVQAGPLVTTCRQVTRESAISARCTCEMPRFVTLPLGGSETLTRVSGEGQAYARVRSSFRVKRATGPPLASLDPPIGRVATLAPLPSGLGRTAAARSVNGGGGNSGRKTRVGRDQAVRAKRPRRGGQSAAQAEGCGSRNRILEGDCRDRLAAIPC